MSGWRKEFHLHGQPIPADMRIYEPRLEVMGLSRRKSDGAAFCKGKNRSLSFRPEPNNKHDPNAIAVIATWKGWLFSKQALLGYVPREVAARLSETQLTHSVNPRLLKTYVGRDGFVDIEYQILGPSSDYGRYKPKPEPLSKQIAVSGEAGGDIEKDLLAAILAEERAGLGVTARTFLPLAMLYRKQKRIDEELALLQRFAGQKVARGRKQEELLERLEKLQKRSD
ncbi:HIRAN domain-containing protein [Neorhizobium sp. NCHU2750]|uniref:HIRAN domain-containing protein n=1 Tax=Neorhizobium sp. NCHU2750 TaxID=1825976 RepID=UPI000EB74E11|nr:hypothetical protein NCHU2750_06030 [Neorhizobium sp. NCHU2750]